MDKNTREEDDCFSKNYLQLTGKGQKETIFVVFLERNDTQLYNLRTFPVQVRS